MLKILKENFIEVFSNRKYILLSFTTFSIFLLTFYFFSDYKLICGNYGNLHLNILILTQILISMLFALFLSFTSYKFITFSSFSPTEQTTSTIGVFFGTLVTGCTSCSLTLASYLGLAGIISLLPYGGLELNILSVVLLLIGTFFTLKNLKVCKFKIKHNSIKNKPKF